MHIHDILTSWTLMLPDSSSSLCSMCPWSSQRGQSNLHVASHTNSHMSLSLSESYREIWCHHKSSVNFLNQFCKCTFICPKLFLLPSCDNRKVVPDPKLSQTFYIYYWFCPFSLFQDPSANRPPLYSIFNLSFTANLILPMCRERQASC